MDNSDITHVSTSPARGNDNHAVNERSSVSPATTSQAVALQNAAASTRNVTHQDSMLAASPPESKNSSVYVDRADKDGAKRKRDVDEIAIRRQEKELLTRQAFWMTRTVLTSLFRPMIPVSIVLNITDAWRKNSMPS
jgi:hypothetical protein